MIVQPLKLALNSIAHELLDLFYDVLSFISALKIYFFILDNSGGQKKHHSTFVAEPSVLIFKHKKALIFGGKPSGHLHKIPMVIKGESLSPIRNHEIIGCHSTNMVMGNAISILQLVGALKAVVGKVIKKFFEAKHRCNLPVLCGVIDYAQKKLIGLRMGSVRVYLDSPGVGKRLAARKS